jgi:myo-inositol-1(or 4)-monophosphatase
MTSKQLGDLALAAARAGSAAIAEVLRDGRLVVEQKTASYDVVTTADRASEEAILRCLRDARPDDAILAEETGAHDGTSAVQWLVDPLDGTLNFSYGRPDHAVSVAAKADGRVVAAAIVRPADGRWVAAGPEGVRRGQDEVPGLPVGHARVASRPPRVAGRSAEDAVVSVGLPYDRALRAQVFALAAVLVGRLRAVRAVGSAACDLLSVASGEIDAFLACDLAPWDTAAGEVIVPAAGGTVVPFESPLGFAGQVFAGDPTVGQRLAEWVTAIGLPGDGVK